MMALDMKQSYAGELSRDVMMSRYTTWRVGGPADRLYKPRDLHDLSVFMQTLDPDEAIFWIGLGSNILVRDAGIRGTVIAVQGLLKQMSIITSGCVRIEAGVSCAKVARYCQSQRLKGAEFLAGIPGTMGGALAMNAGAFGSETWEKVCAVETINRSGKVSLREANEFEVSYRQVKGLDDEWFVAAHLQLDTVREAEQQQIKQRMKSLLAERNLKQPIGLPSCGSVFKNPEGQHAAQLIEQCGLKGLQIGGAQVSEKHANFIINLGSASAQDIEQLIVRVAEAVESKTGISLVPEVRIVGEAGQ